MIALMTDGQLAILDIEVSLMDAFGLCLKITPISYILYKDI